MRTRPGFTLIELLIVIAIIAILAAVLIPNLLAGRTTALERAAQVHSRNVYQAILGQIASTPDTPAQEVIAGADDCMVAGAAAPDSAWTWTKPPENVVSCQIAASGADEFAVTVETRSGVIFVNGAAPTE